MWPKKSYIARLKGDDTKDKTFDWDDSQTAFLEYSPKPNHITIENVQFTGDTFARQPIKMSAGQETKISIEMDLDASSNMRDWAVTAWGDEGGKSISITPDDAKLKSDHWPAIK